MVLEGSEGVGKTTQAARLVARLAARGIDADTIREPGGDPFAEAGRQLLLGPIDRRPETEVLLFNATRAQVLLSKVQPALRRGRWVVADRGRLSTVAYQGYGHGVDLEWTRTVCATVSALCPPDLEVVLDVDPATARARRQARGVTDRFEALPDGFHQRVADGYRSEAAARALPVVDATGPEDVVEQQLWDVIAPLLPVSRRR